MKVRFLGGVAEVGRLGMVLEHDRSRFLFDYGIAPSDPPKYPEPCPPIQAAFLSHAHLDHSGYFPWVAGKHGAPIWMSPVTKPLAELLCNDSLKVCKAEGYPLPFSREDVHAMVEQTETFELGDDRRFGSLDATFHSAGHIPGSTMTRVDDGSKSLMFTGDVNLIDTHLCASAKPVKCDTLVVESTYAGRQHPARPATEAAFLDAVDGVIAQGGTVVVPSFAVGRAQEMLMVLAGQGYEVWLDGMAKAVTQHMLAEPRSLRSARELSRAFEGANLVKTPHQRDRAAEGDVIITTSGMMDGGPVLTYVEKLRNDERNAIFFTGFQVPGSGGRQLLDTGTIDVAGVPERVRCEVRSFDFSAHAGHDELVAFIRGCAPENLVLFHSDRREPLADAVADTCKVHLPLTGDVVDLD